MRNSPATQSWKGGELNKALIHYLPAYIDAPFNGGGNLNIRALMEPVGRSHEAIYQWLRKGELSLPNAKRLVKAAQTPENLKALAALNREPPTIRDFEPFYLGDD